MDPMSGDMYWTNMVTGEADVAGLDDLNFPFTQKTQQIHETASQVQEVDQIHAGGARPPSSWTFSKRSKNFDPKEDEVVVSAWLNVSKDPVHRANQTKRTFWSRIHAFFEKHKKTPTYRSESSIMHRWMTILTQVNKYCGCYEATELRNQSGSTIADKVSQASEMYKRLDQENKTFTLMHCWTLLKEEDKWKAKRKELAEQQKKSTNKKQKVQPKSTPRQGADTENEDVTEITAVQAEERKRPQGQKAAKEALKRGRGEACMDALDKMWTKKEAFDKEKEKEERYLASLEIEKKRLALDERKVEMDLIEKEEKILSMDLTLLSPVQQQYYQLMQEKILARRLAN